MQINVILPSKKVKEKSHTIISIDTEKPFDKVQHSFMIKTLNNIGIEDHTLIKKGPI